MRGLGLILAGTIALAGCGGEKTVYSDADGNEVKVTREEGGEASEIKIESADGSATVNIESGPNGAKLPMGLQAYPGAKIVSTMASDTNGKTGAMVVMESSADRDTVVAWYRKAAEAQGFKIESEISTQELRAISGSKEGGSFTLQAVPAETGSSITLIAGEG